MSGDAFMEEVAAGYRRAAGEHWRSALRARERGNDKRAEQQAGYAAENLAIARSLAGEDAS